MREVKHMGVVVWRHVTFGLVMELEMEDVGKDLAERSASSNAASQRDQQDQAAENGGSAIEREEGKELLASDKDGKTSYNIDHKFNINFVKKPQSSRINSITI